MELIYFSFTIGMAYIQQQYPYLIHFILNVVIKMK